MQSITLHRWQSLFKRVKLATLQRITTTKSWTGWHAVKWDSHVWHYDCHLVIFVALKKAFYMFEIWAKWTRASCWKGIGHTHMQVHVYFDGAVVLFVWLGTVRDLTLGCGCNWPWQTGLFEHVETYGGGMGRRVQGLCLRRPPHVCLCGSTARAPGCGGLALGRWLL